MLVTVTLKCTYIYDDNLVKNVIHDNLTILYHSYLLLGELTNSEVSNTRVDVVLKSEDTKYNLLLVLKRHFLFSQLRDNELEDVIDVMHALYVEEDTVIIREGEKGESFYILEEGMYVCMCVYNSVY